MKTVIDNKIEIIIKKSKFITLTYNVSSKEVIKNKLDYIKNKYKDSTHVCYAYIVNSQEKYDDDGEPNGTAGMPILNILQKENLNNVLCVVVRYFGGIKLGAGGLVRAYAKACKEAIITKQLQKGFKIIISFNYSDVKTIDYLIKDCEITDKCYDSKTTYTFLIKEELYMNIIDNLKQICTIIEEEKILI